MKRRGGTKSGSLNKKRSGRPFGENSNSGKGLMTKYTRPSGGTRATMKVSGKPARSNGVKLLKGMSKTLRGSWS